MNDYPEPIVPAGGTAPVPRRIRATLDGRVVLDTMDAIYLWEIPPYPQYYVPVADVADGVLTDTGETKTFDHGVARVHTAGSGKAWVYDEGIAKDRVRFQWSALDSWFEEDEEVFVHPRNPYARCDAIRSGRHVKVELDGTVLAESRSTVIVFETGLPPRYYFPRTEVNFEHLTPSGTRTACPYKGRTTAYWSVGDHHDLAWSYDFPTAPLLPIAGLVAFFNEKVDLFVDGERLARPITPFTDADLSTGQLV
ncbi:uncharacterized protein (DUF427 family) [Kribbella sp. VKM Ac-2527]|uniref:Uncharacterized protein (DUF427 family) n=1 Tax=Kribbella caucasensis TaxID=2512215 RepID=A0A4R6K5D6_9ACTN|nr:DUF427 domain-containing protein [Kribbella sp. VKM Ac-2527]TDO44596.1 uncharacterized protein (DUF427 family) [Kribbella sp. VKM Ac-2527]